MLIRRPAVRPLAGARMPTLPGTQATVPATRGNGIRDAACADKHSRRDLPRHARLRYQRLSSVQTTP